MRSFNVGGDFWGLMRHKQDRDVQRLTVPVMKSWDVLMTTERLFQVLRTHNGKRGWKSELVFLYMSRWHICTQSEHIKSFLADGCADTLQTFMSSRHSHTESLSFTHSTRLSAFCLLGSVCVVLCNLLACQSLFLFLKCFTLLLNGSELTQVDWQKYIKNICRVSEDLIGSKTRHLTGPCFYLVGHS